MISVAVIGARGFVGSAVSALLASEERCSFSAVTRDSYSGLRGRRFDVVIDCSANSRKYLADERPLEDFDQTVAHRLRTLLDFQAGLHVHVSSVDVYDDLSSPLTTREDHAIEPARSSRYGFHKWLAEQLVRRYADRWLIVRLAGMVGPGLRKNPVYDILNQQPLRIHPDSLFQFLHTSDVARIIWNLVEKGFDREVFNVCGEGLITPKEVARLAARPLDLSQSQGTTRRVVDASIGKLRGVCAVPATAAAVAAFVETYAAREAHSETR